MQNNTKVGINQAMQQTPRWTFGISVSKVQANITDASRKQFLDNPVVDRRIDRGSNANAGEIFWHDMARGGKVSTRKSELAFQKTADYGT